MAGTQFMWPCVRMCCGSGSCLVGPAGGHMRVLEIMPCMSESEYPLLHTAKLHMAHQIRRSVFDGTCHCDNRRNSRAETCVDPSHEKRRLLCHWDPDHTLTQDSAASRIRVWPKLLWTWSRPGAKRVPILATLSRLGVRNAVSRQPLIDPRRHHRSLKEAKVPV